MAGKIAADTTFPPLQAVIGGVTVATITLTGPDAATFQPQVTANATSYHASGPVVAPNAVSSQVDIKVAHDTDIPFSTTITVNGPVPVGTATA